MIRVDRSREAEPAILGRKIRGKSETDLAIEHYTNGWNGKSGFPFKRYKADKVKAALEKLFHGKCAYCESRFAHVSPEDIEHWRPKRSVQLKDGSEILGYYWLAATWSNLLPSCIDCNRRRRQIDVLRPDHLQSGKESLFPVADEAHRWTHRDQVNRNGEQPLLLDPTEDDPRLYLEVVERDGRTVMGEKAPQGTLENERARATIEIFGLNRAGLEAERHRERLDLQTLFEDAWLAVKLLQDPGTFLSDEARTGQRNGLIRKLKQIEQARDPGSPYLLMKIPLIDGFLAGILPMLQQLGLL